MLPVRHNFLNSFRYGDGGYSERSIRNQFNRKINFPGWFDAAFGTLRQKECIAAFDPSYIPKSGIKIYRKLRFWSGKDQRAKLGLEMGWLALVDVADEMAYSIEAVQTLVYQKEKLMGHYVDIIKKKASRTLRYTEYLTVDRYFMKKFFIEPVLYMGLQVITRMRLDANLQYIYKTVPRSGAVAESAIV